MLILPKSGERSRPMLLAVTAAVIVGVCVATLLRLQLRLSVAVPLTLAKVVVPMLAVPWLWHWRQWPGAVWVETTLYVLMVGVAQMYMEVDITVALFLVPVIGVLYRRRSLTIYGAVTGALAYGVLLAVRPLAVQAPDPLLQFGAYSVLLGALAITYSGLIALAAKAERSLVQARLTEQMAMQWAASIEARDQYTGGHVERVTRYALELAPLVPDLGMDLDLFRLAAVLHDVGKIAVPDQILNKPAALTWEEYKVMQSHTTNGYDLVLRTNVPPEVADVVRHHHERWDGKGYPDGLSGRHISKASRVLAVADAFDAMTSDRPYRRALTPEQARQEILAGAGSQFDPAVVALFEAVFGRWAEIARTR